MFPQRGKTIYKHHSAHRCSGNPRIASNPSCFSPFFLCPRRYIHPSIHPSILVPSSSLHCHAAAPKFSIFHAQGKRSNGSDSSSSSSPFYYVFVPILSFLPLSLSLSLCLSHSVNPPGGFTALPSRDWRRIPLKFM